MNWWNPQPQPQPRPTGDATYRNAINRRPGSSFASPQGAPGAGPARPSPIPSQRQNSSMLRGQAAPGRTARQGGYNFPRAEVRDPMADLFALAEGAGSYSGGSGGSYNPGNGDAIRALVAQLEKSKGAAGERYKTNRAQITDMYGQLRDSLEPNAGYTEERYDKAISTGEELGSGIAEQTLARQSEQDAQRDAAFQSLGIEPGLVSEEADATSEGLERLAQQNSTWGNMMGVMSNAQQSRDMLDVQGATDAGILANREMTNTYEDYLRQLENEIAQTWSQYVAPSSSGGSAPSYSNPMMDQLNALMFDKMAMDAGLMPDPNAGQFVPDMGGIGAFVGQLQSGLGPDGRPLSGNDLTAMALRSGQNPRQMITNMQLLNGQLGR